MYLAISDEQIELCDADDVWGLPTSQTEAAIRRAWGDSQVKVAAIGPAGENTVRFASIQVTSQRSLGRCGLGAVMGSKQLKAIAVRGRGLVRVADPARFHELAVEFHRRIRANPIYPAVSAHGTPGIVSLMDALGRFPTRNFQLGSFAEVDQINAEALEARAFVRHLACFGCPIGCDALYSLSDGPHAGTSLHSVEYETLNSMGANVMNADLDTISAGRSISFAMELWENDILNRGDTGGLKLRWGDMDVVLRLLEMIARREGFGDLLAEGVRRAAQTIGRGAGEYAMHVKGMEIPAQDGRAQKSMGLAHVTSNRGADHLKAFPTIDETGYPDEALRRYGEEYLPEMAQPLATKHKPLLVKDGEDFGAVVDSVGVHTAPLLQGLGWFGKTLARLERWMDERGHACPGDLRGLALLHLRESTSHPSTLDALSTSGHRAPLAFAFDAEACTWCGRCVTVCAYHARRLTSREEMLLDEHLCRSCGLCISVCPTEALRWLPDSSVQIPGK